MTLDEMRALKKGQLIRVLVPAAGGVYCATVGDEIEVELPAGHLAEVGEVVWCGPVQKWGVTVHFDCGIDNVFDEGDDNGNFPFQVVEKTPDVQAARIASLTALYIRMGGEYPASELAWDVEYVLTGKRPDEARLHQGANHDLS